MARETSHRVTIAFARVKEGKEKGATTFIIDYAKPVEDKIMDITSLEKFLQEHIKVATTSLTPLEMSSLSQRKRIR